MKSNSAINETKKTYNFLSNLNLMNVPISKLLTPLGMNFNKWHTTRKTKYLGGSLEENLETRFVDNPVLYTYMKYNNEDKLTPSTLVPLGVMIFTYNDYNNKFNLPKKKRELDDLQKDEEITINNHDLSKEIVKVMDIDEDILSPSLKVPFAVLLGRDMLSYYLHKNKDYLEMYGGKRNKH